MLVSEAAQKIGMSTQTLRLGLQQRLFPFGEAIKTSEKRYVYHINPKALEKYIEGNSYEKSSTNNNCDSDLANGV